MGAMLEILQKKAHRTLAANNPQDDVYTHVHIWGVLTRKIRLASENNPHLHGLLGKPRAVPVSL
jgi:hypothetical protein